MKKTKIFVVLVFLQLILLILLIPKTKIYAASNVVNFTGTQQLGVGESIDINSKLLPSIDLITKSKLKITSSNNDVIFVAHNSLKLYAIAFGSSNIEIYTDDDVFRQTFDINVVKKNILTDDGVFKNLNTKLQFVTQRQVINNWDLYTGNQAVDKNNQIVTVETKDGMPTVTYEHIGYRYSNLFYIQKNIPNGHYYLEGEIKGSNLLNNVYYRLNQGGKIENQTQPVKGTFGWREFKSGLAEVNNNQIKIELYAANVSGKVEFRNFRIYRVLDISYLDYNIDRETIILNTGQSFKVKPTVDNLSQIEYDFDLEIQDTNIASISKLDNSIKAKNKGITKLIITDRLYKYRKEVTLLVGVDTNLVNSSYSFEVNEDEKINISINNSSLKYIGYDKPKNGNYTLFDNKIVYYPNKDYNSANEYTNQVKELDSFKIIVVDNNFNYQIVDINVDVKSIVDKIETIDFWLSTPKDTKLEKGYVEIRSRDIDTNIPNSRHKSSPNLEDATKAYNKISTTINNSLVGASQKGGLVKLLNNGFADKQTDRYTQSSGNYIFSQQFEYTPPAGFIGYDKISLTSTINGVSTNYDVVVYVLPEHNDFKFDSANFNSTYLLASSKWINETIEAYNNGDKYLKEIIDYYSKNLDKYQPTAVPAKARTPLEQLAVLYKITKDDKFFNLAWDQLDAITNSKRLSWGRDSNGFLDAAMVSYSVSFAYNYLIDKLNDHQIKQVIKALYEEAFYFYDQSRFANPNVLLHGNNHNLLINGNMAISALAIMNYKDDLEVEVDGAKQLINVRKVATTAVKTAFELLQIGLSNYGSNGGFLEGPSYSYYAHRNMVSLIATLKNIYPNETDYSFGLMDILGIKFYPNYTLYTQTPNYSTFFYNEGNYTLNQPALLWYARVSDKYIPYTYTNYVAFQQKIYNAQSILWYKPGMFDNIDQSIIKDTDFLLKNHEIATLRQNFGDNLASFIGLKTYNPTSSSFAHKSLDHGTFEIVALGEKFIENFSNEDYFTSVPPGFWKYDYARWLYYKKQAQGHNTLIINPQSNPVIQQDINEKGQIIKLESGNDTSFAVADLSNVYKKDAYLYKRGAMLFDNKKNFVIQDEFELRKNSELYFQVHSTGEIFILDDKTAVIIKNNKKLYAKLLTDGKFETSIAKPIPQTIGLEGNIKLDGLSKLYVHLNDVVKGTISVVFIPSMDGIYENKYSLTKIDNWKAHNIENVNNNLLDDVVVNDELGSGQTFVYNKHQKVYNVIFSSDVLYPPEFKYSYNEKLYKLNILNAKYFGDKTVVEIVDIKTNKILDTYIFYINTQVHDNTIYTNNINFTTTISEVSDDDPITTKKLKSGQYIDLEVDSSNIVNMLNIITYTSKVRNVFDIYYMKDNKYQYLNTFSTTLDNTGSNIINIGAIKTNSIRVKYLSNNNLLDVVVADIYLLSREVSYKFNNKDYKVNVGSVLPEINVEKEIVKEGVKKTFIGFLDNISSRIYNSGDIITNDLSLSAQYRDSYLVEFKYQNESKKDYYEKGSIIKPIELTSSQKNGFKGWYDEDGNVFDFSKQITKPTTIYAKHELKSAFDINLLFIILGSILLVVAASAITIHLLLIRRKNKK